MTLEEFYKATEGMPMNAEIGVKYVLYDNSTKILVTDVECDKTLNEIMLC